jgi:hypothetical protein
MQVDPTGTDTFHAGDVLCGKAMPDVVLPGDCHAGTPKVAKEATAIMPVNKRPMAEKTSAVITISVISGGPGPASKSVG